MYLSVSLFLYKSPFFFVSLSISLSSALSHFFYISVFLSIYFDNTFFLSISIAICLFLLSLFFLCLTLSQSPPYNRQLYGNDSSFIYIYKHKGFKAVQNLINKLFCSKIIKKPVFLSLKSWHSIWKLGLNGDINIFVSYRVYTVHCV